MTYLLVLSEVQSDRDKVLFIRRLKMNNGCKFLYIIFHEKIHNRRRLKNIFNVALRPHEWPQNIFQLFERLQLVFLVALPSHIVVLCELQYADT